MVLGLAIASQLTPHLTPQKRKEERNNQRTTPISWNTRQFTRQPHTLSDRVSCLYH